MPDLVSDEQELTEVEQHLSRLSYRNSATRYADRLLRSLRVAWAELAARPEIPSCHVHEKMLIEKTLPTPLDNCIVCTRRLRRICRGCCNCQHCGCAPDCIVGKAPKP